MKRMQAALAALVAEEGWERNAWPSKQLDLYKQNNKVALYWI